MITFLSSLDGLKELRGWTGSYNVFSILSSLEGTGIESFSWYDYGSTCATERFTIPSTLKSLSLGTYRKIQGYYKISDLPNDVVSEKGTSLSTITMYSTDISNLSFLNGLTQLTAVDLRYGCATSLEGVTNTLPNVTSLNLSYNNITSLYGIQYFTGLKTLNLSYNTSLGDTCSYGGTTYFNLKLLSDLRTNNQTLTKLTLTGCTGLNTDSTNSYWTTLKGLSGLTVAGP